MSNRFWRTRCCRVVCHRRRLLLRRRRDRRSARRSRRRRSREGVHRVGALRSRMKMRPNSRLLQLLNNRTHRITMLSQIRPTRRRHRCISNVQLTRRQDILQVPQKHSSVLLRPKINIKRVNRAKALLLIALVESIQVPLSLTGNRSGVQRESKNSRLLVRVPHPLNSAQVSEESILIRRPSVIRNLELRAVRGGIVVEVGVAASGKAMVQGF